MKNRVGYQVMTLAQAIIWKVGQVLFRNLKTECGGHYMAEETAKTESVLDSVEPAAEEKQETPADEQVMDVTAEAAPAEEKFEYPEYFPKQFQGKDGLPMMEEFSKSYNDMRKIISQGRHKAPEDGNYKIEGLSEEQMQSEQTKALLDFAKDNSLSQQQFDNFLGLAQHLTAEGSGELTDAQKEQIRAEELAALGPNGEAIVKDIATWANGFVQKGILSEEDFNELKIMVGTAAGVKVMQKIRSSYEGKIPLVNNATAGQKSKAELEQMVSDPRYNTDPAYREQVWNEYQNHYPNQ